jgi:hypothetical protein
MASRRVTPARTITVPDAEWDALLQLGEKAGRSASDLIREQIVALLEANGMMPKVASRPVINPAARVVMVMAPKKAAPKKKTA